MAGEFQRGEPRPVMVPVPTASAIAEGDLIALDSSGNARLASGQTWNTDKATTRVAFCAIFAGVSAQAKTANLPVLWNAGFPGQIKINAGGVVSRTAAAGTYLAGDMVGPAKQSGNLLDDQIVEVVTSEAEAIGIVVGSPGVNPATVDVELLSRKFRPSPTGDKGVRPTVAATGSVIGDAAPLTEGFTVVTAADGTKGVLLPVAVAGSIVKIKNSSALVLKVWPQTGATINALSASAAMSIAAQTCPIFEAVSATQWYSSPLLPS